jgi:hypothetical protein
MDKQKISRQLHRLAQEEIPDTMNLWPKIHGQLKRKPKPRSFSLAHALSVFVMTMLVAVGGYAAYQTGNTADPVAPTLGTELNLVQSSEAMTASVDWVYADSSIIAIQYSVIYNPDFVNDSLYIDTVLRNSTDLLSPYRGGAEPVILTDGSVKYTGYSFFSTFCICDQPTTFAVTFDIYAQQFILMDVSPTVPPPANFTATPVPFEGQIITATPFGEFEQSVSPTETPSQMGSPFDMPTVPPPDWMTIEPSLIPPMQFTPTPVQIANYASFSFNFDLTFNPTISRQGGNTEAESNERLMSIQNLTVTPLRTSFELCYQYPDLMGTWYPKVAVDTGFAPADAQRYSPIIETMLEDYGTLYEASEETIFIPSALNWQMSLNGIDHTNCIPLSSFAAIDPEANELDIRVDYLYRETDPTDLAVWNNDVDFFASRGISVQYELSRGNVPELSENVLLYPLLDIGSIMVTIQDYPETMTLEDASSFVRSNMLKERLEGDWSFHITLE